MRVLVVPKWYPSPERPVFGIFCREQARAIARAHDVVVLASEAIRDPPFVVFELSDGVEEGVRTCRLRYRRPHFRPAAMVCQIVGMLVALRRLRREGWRPEIVHAHVYSAGLPALLLGRLSRAKVVVSEHYTGFQRGLITGYDRLTARVAFTRADLVAPVSEYLAREVLALAPRARVRVVGNVVDTDVFHPARGKPARPRAAGARLLNVASLAPKKGQSDLLKALVELRGGGEDFTLDIVGDGELRDSLRELADDLGLGAAARFHGERLKEEVAELMREADLFVLPSLFENLPCVLIEATASGLPWVATDVGGVRELIDGAGGSLCAPGDPRALAGAISAAAAARRSIDPSVLAERARSRFGYEAIERIWTQIYDELASSAGTTSSATVRATAPGR
jgi:glycosyltransferase involved in cell wall biosynthesis